MQTARCVRRALVQRGERGEDCHALRRAEDERDVEEAWDVEEVQGGMLLL